MTATLNAPIPLSPLCRCDFSGERGEAGECKHCTDFGIRCHVTARIKPPRPSTSTPSKVSTLAECMQSVPLLTAHAPLQEPAASQRWQRSYSVALTEPRYSGATSLSQLVSAVTRKWPSRADRVLSKMDSQYGHARVDGVSGGPFLLLPQVRYPPEQAESKEMEEARLSIETKRECESARWLWRAARLAMTLPRTYTVLEKYQRFVAPLFSILSDKESEGAVEMAIADQLVSSLSNLALAMLSVAAMTRTTAVETRMALLYHLRRRPHLDISSSLETIQYLLLLSANVEILSPDTNISSGMSLNLTGLVTRMAQDLGLHRQLSQLAISQHHLRRRARIWAACIVQDRWYSLSYGQPCLIHLEDCDAHAPSPYHDGALDSVEAKNMDTPYEVHVQHFKLSVLMSRMLRLVFTPTGLQHTSVKDMERLKEDLDEWSSELPASLRVTGRPREAVSIGAGFLHLLKVAIDFIFYRAALVSTHNTSKRSTMSPPHIWESLVKRSAQAIEWVATPEGTSVLDAWSVAMYALIQSCLVQFYATVGGDDPAPLRLARQCLQSWSSSTEAQSHGYYDPSEGDELLPSSTTTSAHPTSPSAKGKKSLTLRTKAYTLVAMLTGIAEHHIAGRSPPPQAAAAVTLRRPSQGMAPLLHAAAPPSTSPPVSAAYRFDAVLNPDVVHPSSSFPAQVQQHSPHIPPPFAASSLQGHHVAQPMPMTTTTFTAHAPPPNTSDGYAFGGNIEQIDLVTLQRWADEVMRNAPNVDPPYPLQQHNF